jgi:magnesium chelatase accessory protein
MAPRFLDWQSDGQNWPYRAQSRFVSSGASTWHVQHFQNDDSNRKTMLLLHGTGASTHSFAPLIDHLLPTFDLLAVDLPGHGFTKTRSSSALSLTAIAFGVSRLLAELQLEPSHVLAHSAGGAIALQMTLDQPGRFDQIHAINAALEPIEGNALLSPLAKLLFVNPLTPRIFSWQARNTAIAEKMLGATGTKLPTEIRAQYETLFGSPAHVEGALGMMANWELKPLRARLREINVPVNLYAAKDDGMVPNTVSRTCAGELPLGTYVELTRGGHLVHEVQPELVAGLVLERG